MKHLLSPITIGTLELKNRVIMPAMGTCMPTIDGYVSKQLINYHVARAKGGCALNIVEVCSVHETAKRPEFLSIHKDKYIDGLLDLTTAIHKSGGKAAVQLWHFGALIPDVTGQYETIAPSDFPPGVPKEHQMARSMTLEDISDIQQAYVDATVRAIQAGFDAIELHFGHGYLVAQFLSPNHNYRTDEYGGSLENRMRFPLEIVRKIRTAIGPDFPILTRISAEEGTPNGYDLKDMITFSKALEAEGVDTLDVSYGTPFGSALIYEVPPIDIPIGFNVDRAYQIKQNVSIPIMTVGRINDPLYAEDILLKGHADLIGIGRGQLSDPDFCNKAMSGEVDTIVKCVACDQGCFDNFSTPGAFISCLRNPACGREEDYQLKLIDKQKNIVVLGGGPAGLEASIILNKRGHRVTLLEKTHHLGGQLRTAGFAPRKQEMSDAAIHMGETASKLDIDIRLNTPATEQLIRSMSPDEVIIAIGSEPIIPPITGVDKTHVKSSHLILRGLEQANGHVLVIGGGLVGCEVAEYCADNNQQVTIVEMQDELAKDLGHLRKICVLDHIKQYNITSYTNAKCLEIFDNSVKIEQDNQLLVLNDIDTVVLAVGTQSSNSTSIVTACQDLDINYHIIGDALNPRRAIDAIFEASKLGRTL